MVSLALKDIQGNILRGYGFPFAAYLFLTIPDASSGRRFLGEIVGDVTTAEPWDETPATTTNVALTYAGLRALAVTHSVLCELPDAFREPIRERAPRALDDKGPSAPRYWDKGLGTDRSHILVTISGSTGNEQPFKDAVMGVIRRAERHGLDVVHQDDAEALKNRREHFGWADGFGQPAIEGGTVQSRPGQGVPQDDGVTWRDLKAGEFVLGYPDEDGHVDRSAAAPLLRNGTYMVYRKLYQDVARFRRELYMEAARYAETVRLEPALDSDQLYELMAAKVVGRWRDGVAIELAERRTEADSRMLGEQALEEPDNDFRYSDDGAGLKCPVGAHIRRTNPRDALGREASGRHRIIRRGMPYGPYLNGLEDDGEERGLLFICFNASIERQFEVVQAQWCNDGNAFRLGDDKDYLLGDNGGTGKVTIQGHPPHMAQAQPLLVLTRGCEYLLMPGITALRDLAAEPHHVSAPDHESVPPGEAAAVAQVVERIRETYERTYTDVRAALRDQHANSHGCVRADFVVGPDVPPDLRHGIFATPRTYAAWIRFSSSSRQPGHDSKRNKSHGIAIKVMGIEGEKVLASERDGTTQDFVLGSTPNFVCRTASDYVPLLDAMDSKVRKYLFFAGAYPWAFPFPWRWRGRELVNLMVAVFTEVTNPLQSRYWSQTPYALGPHAVKYSAKPQGRRTDREPVSDHPNHLEEAMARQLEASGEVSFDFMVQLRTDPAKMPVEDPTVRWNERVSPFRKVATIRIPAQDFTSKARRNFAEGLSFTPWHSLPEHRPLGGINRVRGAVYDAISQLRHEKNDTPRREPTEPDVT